MMLLKPEARSCNDSSLRVKFCYIDIQIQEHASHALGLLSVSASVNTSGTARKPSPSKHRYWKIHQNESIPKFR